MPIVVNRKQELHDQLLAQKPETAEHDSAACELCTSSNKETPQVQTFSAEELQAAIDAATAELQSQLAAIESAAQESEIEARVAAATAEAAAEVEALRAQLDVAVLERQAAIDELSTFKAELEALEAAEEEAKTVAARREERLAQVKEVASFTDEYLEANADRFAAMSDEDFEARLAEYAAISKPSGGIPKTTALTSAREVASDNNNSRSIVGDFMRGTLTGIDPRTL